jgi:hypothetical protein
MVNLQCICRLPWGSCLLLEPPGVFAALYEAEDVSEGRQVDGRCSYGAAVFKVVRFCSWFQHHTSLVFFAVACAVLS